MKEQATCRLLTLLPSHRAERLLDHRDGNVDVRADLRQGRLEQLALREQLLPRLDAPKRIDEVLICETLPYLGAAQRGQRWRKRLPAQHVIEAGHHGKAALRQASHVYLNDALFM